MKEYVFNISHGGRTESLVMLGNSKEWVLDQIQALYPGAVVNWIM